MGRRGLLAAILAVVLAGAAVAGCGSSKKSSSTSSGTSTSGAGSTSGASSTSSGTASAPAAGGARTLRTSADPRGALAFTKKTLTAQAGKVTIVMNNPSSSGLQHGISVEGNGVDKDGSIVGPGNSATVTVTLKPGKYQFYCPFDGHKAAGMTGTLTVT